MSFIQYLWFSQKPLMAFGMVLLTLGLSYLTWIPIYNLFFHPLRNYPGPKLYGASRIPYVWMVFSGQSHKRVLELHQKYGDVIRISPGELSYLRPEAWNDIMGHRKRGQEENGKDPAFWQTSRNSVASADRQNHGRMRKVLSHAFSAQEMMEQQPLIQSYVDLLIKRLQEHSAGGTRSLNMVSWYNWTTFDIIGDLSFGEPFGCLERSDYHPWVRFMFSRIRGNAINMSLYRFPFGFSLQKILTPKAVREGSKAHGQAAKEKVLKRMELENPRHDFMQSMLREEAKSKMTFPEIVDNSAFLMLAGSETTATTLSGVTYLLTTNPSVLEKLVQEVRSSFSMESEIDLLSVQKLNYMLAVLDEAIRMYPPVPTAIPRRTPAEGNTICGQYVPGGTSVGIWQWPMYHDPRNFALPESFIPERWLGDPRFVNDKKEALQPFSAGPRNCLGKNLAYAEMRLILAKVIWNFDLKLADESKNWLERNEVFALWQKPGLQVYLTPRRS